MRHTIFMNHPFKSLTILLWLAFGSTINIWAANYYILPTGSGPLKDGSSWNNAFPASRINYVVNSQMKPGDTLYIGSGKYGDAKFSINSSGEPGKLKQIIGVNLGGGYPVFDCNQTAVAPNWSPSQPSNGMESIIIFEKACSYWTIQGLTLRSCTFAVYSRKITSGSHSSHITLKSLNIENVGTGLYVNDMDNLSVSSCSIKKYTKKGFRLNRGCDNAQFQSCVADQTNGDTSWRVYSEIFPTGFCVTDGAEQGGAPNHNVAFTDCSALSNRVDGQLPGDYWNGDGFTVEETVTGTVSFKNCIGIDNEDAGFDIKAQATFIDCMASLNKRNFRCWYGTTTLKNCASTYPFKRGGTGAALGFWTKDATITLDYFTFLGDDSYAISEEGNGIMKVNNSILAYTGNLGTFIKVGSSAILDSSTVMFRPGSGIDPLFVNPIKTWDGSGANMNSKRYGLSKGFNSERTPVSGTSTGGSTAPRAVISAPSSLVAKTISTTGINLSWIDNSNNESGFKIERKTGASAYSVIATVGVNIRNYKDRGLTPNTLYYYRIIAFNMEGSSSYSNISNSRTLSH